MLVESRHWTIGAPPCVGQTKIAVHPGWLSPERQTDNDPEVETVDLTVHFEALNQILRTAGSLERAATGILSELGLTAGAFFTLLELEAANGQGLAPSELARRLAVARRTATLYVEVLLKRGWVSRSIHPQDKRMVLAHITPEGYQILATVGPIFKDRLARLLDALDIDQSADLRDLLRIVPLPVDGVNGYADLTDSND